MDRHRLIHAMSMLPDELAGKVRTALQNPDRSVMQSCGVGLAVVAVFKPEAIRNAAIHTVLECFEEITKGGLEIPNAA